MRRIMFFILMPLHFLLSIPVLGVVHLIGTFNRPLRRKLAYKFNRVTAWLLYRISGAKFVVKGLENVPTDTNFLLVSNHRSMLDIPLIMLHFKKPMIFIGKDAIRRWPFIGWWLVAMDGLFIDRTSPKEGLKTILTAIERIRAGESCIIYPEGTRTKTKEIQPFKQGSLKLASKTGVPVIPVAVLGTDDVFENNHINLKPETVYLTIGKPIDLSELSKEDQIRSATYIQEIIETMYQAQILEKDIATTSK